MKTYKIKETAFKHAINRAELEGHEMIVVHNRRFGDLTVRKNVGQKPNVYQTFIARCRRVERFNLSGKSTTTWEIFESKTPELFGIK